METRKRKSYTPYLSSKEITRILKLDLSQAVPNTDIMYCTRCYEQYEPGRVGPTQCGICKGGMNYIRFSDKEEILEWIDKQLDFYRRVTNE